MSRRRAAAGIAAAVSAAAAVLAFAQPGHPTAAAQAPPPAVAVHEPEGLPPMPALHPTVVQPAVTRAAPARATAAEPLPAGDPVPRRAATRGSRPARPGAPLGGSVTQARALPNGVAVPPLESPQAVREIIQAGDQIARTPYVWGGGHGKWLDHGYDC